MFLLLLRRGRGHDTMFLLLLLEGEDTIQYFFFYCEGEDDIIFHGDKIIQCFMSLKGE